MKKIIRLTESDIRKMVNETVKKVLNEIDYSSMPTGDFYERNKWFKQQADTDFPGHGIKDSDDWQQTYASLANKKAKQDKLDAKMRAKEKRDALRKKKMVKGTVNKTATMKYGDGVLVVDVNFEECRLSWVYESERSQTADVFDDGEMEIETYVDGTWLPYEETMTHIPSEIEPYLMRMFKKLGMREDNE